MGELVQDVYSLPAFDARIHLAFSPPEKRTTFEALQLNPDNANSSVAVTTPFPLLSTEGVRALRADIFRHDVVARFGSWKYPGVYRIRGYGHHAPFAYEMWKSEEMCSACSQAAQTELEVLMDYEIGQLNVQLPASVDRDAPITDNLPPPEPPVHHDETAMNNLSPNGAEIKEDKALVSAWHHDSYPWVCVLMLSDPTNMRGGETALRTGDGSIMKIKPPGMGYAVMMQGGSIEHAALPCLGDGERITFVTSFRPRDPMYRDSCSLRTVRPISHLDELYRQWSSYRVDVLEQRAAVLKRELSKGGRSAEEIRELVNIWGREQMDFLQRTIDEML